MTQIWTAKSGSLVRRGPTTSSYGSDGWSESVRPWALQPGESVDDNRPLDVLVVDYDDYSQGRTRSLKQTLVAIRAAATEPYNVRLPEGTFHFTDFSFAEGRGVGRCYQDVSSTKYFSGLIGAGADKTFIVVDPEIMTSQQLTGVSSGTPSPISMPVIYTSNGENTGKPTFFSGITFRGNLQQQISLNGLSGTAPAPYSGLEIVRAKSGSFVQFCRFEGFGFAAKNSPPYEAGTVGSLRANWTMKRCEIDGRIAASIDPSRPVASGGVMVNYENKFSIIDTWLHHTRRSGFAMHGHDTIEGGNLNDPGVYHCENLQTDNICNTPDSWAGSSLGFSPSNVEELRRTFTYIKPRFTAYPSVNGYAHITVGTTNGNSIAEQIIVTDPVIGNSDFNKCLYFNFVRVPNSRGTSPYYTLYQQSGLSALPITVTNNGVVLNPVLDTNFNASIHTPDNSYVVRM